VRNLKVRLLHVIRDGRIRRRGCLETGGHLKHENIKEFAGREILRLIHKDK